MHERTEEPVNTPPAGAPAQRGGMRRLLGSVLVAITLVGGVMGLRLWQYTTSRVTTDDAQLTADITTIAPQVNGMVVHVRVKENQAVRAGELLVELDDTSYRAAVAQAAANLQAAVAQAQGAGISVALTAESGTAQLAQAQGGVAQAASSIRGAGADALRADAVIEKARAGAKAAESNVLTARAGLLAAQANKARAQAAIVTAEAGVGTAQATVRAAQANVVAAQASAEKAARDAERYAGLLAKGAISRQAADTTAATARVLQAQLESARQQVEIAQATLGARQAEVQAAKQQVDVADANIAQASAQIANAQDAAGAATADIRQAQAARQSAEQGIHQARARRQQALGQLQQAQTSPHQVAISTTNRAGAQARIAQAQAALDAARIQLAHTRIFAPVSGTVSKRSVEEGALVQPGTPLLALVQQNALWVVANYKETQLAHIRRDLPAEVSVDALGHQRFHGHVDSIAAGTGSTFALLPTDNATGNFTKVVQRVPVKILLDPGQPDADRLCAGLSVSAAVLIRQK